MIVSIHTKAVTACATSDQQVLKFAAMPEGLSSSLDHAIIETAQSVDRTLHPSQICKRQMHLHRNPHAR